MGELRQDVVTGRWVVIATERSRRPTDFGKARATEPPEDRENCPFCPGHEVMTPLEVLAVRPPGSPPNTPGWQVRVFPNKYPAFQSGSGAPPGSELFPSRPAGGSHEVIVHSPDHDASLATMPVEEVELVLQVYRHRYLSNCQDPHVRYVHLIVNHGRGSGASLEHSHSQLFGVPMTPMDLAQELEGSARRYEKLGECVFCALIRRELELGRRVVQANEGFVAIAPFASRFPYEVAILPRKHQQAFDMIDDEQLGQFAGILRDVLRRYYDNLGDPPYNYYIHTAPCDDAPYPHYHWHLEAMPRPTRLGGFELGTGMMINIVSPEDACDKLRMGSDPILNFC